MTKDEAVKKIAREGYISIEHAEELYDSIINKPVVPQYVADWYEEHKNEFHLNLHRVVRMGVQKLNILKWEHETSQISIREAKKLAEYFGVSIGYLLGFDGVLVNDGITDLIAKINEWAISHGLDKGNPKIEWMKVTEEVGEIRDVFLKPNDFDDPELALKDAIGDSIVTLVVLCLQLGYDVEECLKIAYNNIKDRQGVMIDDNFVKTR